MSYIQILNLIKNAQAVGKDKVKYATVSNMGEAVLSVLLKNNYIAGFEKKGRKTKKYFSIDLLYRDCVGAVTDFKLISKPSRRIYKSYKELRSIRQGFGISVLSTSKGIMTGIQARKEKVGGQVLFEIW
jgi:small subunit ribosomal protein S8